MMAMMIEQANVDDSAAILALQKLAYSSEAELYDDFEIPPMVQTLDEITSEFDDHVFLKAVLDNRIIGSVRAKLEGDCCRIGRLVVHPEHQGEGIGTGLMTEIEKRFGEAGLYSLFTGHRSEKQIRLYRKLGYEILGTEKVSDRLSLVFLEKTNNRG